MGWVFRTTFYPIVAPLYYLLYFEIIIYAIGYISYKTEFIEWNN